MPETTWTWDSTEVSITGTCFLTFRSFFLCSEVKLSHRAESDTKRVFSFKTQNKRRFHGRSSASLRRKMQTFRDSDQQIQRWTGGWTQFGDTFVTQLQMCWVSTSVHHSFQMQSCSFLRNRMFPEVITVSPSCSSADRPSAPSSCLNITLRQLTIMWWDQVAALPAAPACPP